MLLLCVCVQMEYRELTDEVADRKKKQWWWWWWWWWTFSCYV